MIAVQGKWNKTKSARLAIVKFIASVQMTWVDS